MPTLARCSCPLNTPALACARVHLQKCGVFSRPYLNRAGAKSPCQQGFDCFDPIRGNARNFGSQPHRPYRNPTVSLARARVLFAEFRQPLGQPYGDSPTLTSVKIREPKQNLRVMLGFSRPHQEVMQGFGVLSAPVQYLADNGRVILPDPVKPIRDGLFSGQV